MSAKTIILALGNLLRGDDGAATAVLTHLRTLPLPDHVTLLDGGTPGLETVLLLQDYQRALIIDAADMGLAPGKWRHFSLDQATLRGHKGFMGTLHSAGLAEALALGAALDILPPHIEIIGIQPQSVDWHEALSTAVTAVVPAVADYIAGYLGGRHPD